MKYVELAPFEQRLTAQIVTETVQASRGPEQDGGQRDGEESGT
jgi:hypothetical protein